MATNGSFIRGLSSSAGEQGGERGDAVEAAAAFRIVRPGDPHDGGWGGEDQGRVRSALAAG